MRAWRLACQEREDEITDEHQTICRFKERGLIALSFELSLFDRILSKAYANTLYRRLESCAATALLIASTAFLPSLVRL